MRIAAGLLLSWLLVAGAGFYVGQHHGEDDPVAAGKGDAGENVDQRRVSGLTPDDECLLAWAKIENSRDPLKYSNFISGSLTRECKQVDLALKYKAEVEAWNSFGGNNQFEIAAHVLRFPDSGSFPAQRQLANLIANPEVRRKLEKPTPAVSVDNPQIALCNKVAQSWKVLTKKQLVWDNMPTALLVLKEARDGRCDTTLRASQKSITTLFSAQRTSLMSEARKRLENAPDILVRITQLLQRAKKEELTDPQAAHRSYQEARSQIDEALRKTAADRGPATDKAATDKAAADKAAADKAAADKATTDNAADKRAKEEEGEAKRVREILNGGGS